MIWNGIKVEKNVPLIREYFESYMRENRYEADTYQCDTLILTMHKIVPWDGDYETFYNFMVENLI